MNRLAVIAAAANAAGFKLVNYKIRVLALEDAEATARLVTQLGYPATSQQMKARLERLLSDSGHALFVAADGGNEVIGLVGESVGYALEFDQPYVRIIVLVVDDRFRRSGVGAMLMGQIEGWARDMGAVTAILTSGVHRSGAHNFYERIGYIRTGLRFVKQLSDTG